jgi:hypothetical protein
MSTSSRHAPSFIASICSTDTRAADQDQVDLEVATDRHLAETSKRCHQLVSGQSGHP